MEILGVTESTARILRQQIVTGQIPSGVKLNENELSNRYGISRPPLREAFRKLEYENLVASVPRKGTYVTQTSVEDCKQVYLTRRVIECAAIDAIAERENADFGNMREAVRAGLSATKPNNGNAKELMDYYDEVAGFHWQMVETCANRWLIHCYRSIGATLARYQIIYLAIPGTQQPSVESHAEILRLIEDRKYRKAKDRLETHILETLQQIVDKMPDCKSADRKLA